MQDKSKMLGQYGCYFFSLIKIGEEYSNKKIDVFRFFDDALQLGYMRYDCFILRPDLILNKITNKKWTVKKEEASYNAKAGEIEILVYEYRDFIHFVLGKKGKVYYDSQESNNVVKKGKLISKRIFTEV